MEHRQVTKLNRKNDSVMICDLNFLDHLSEIDRKKSFELIEKNK